MQAIPKPRIVPAEPPPGGTDAIMLRPLAVPSLGERVADTIVEAIAQGELPPGARVQEVELAARLGVSRVPVREAIKILETKGIVETAPHRGARVAPIDHLRVDQIRAARVALERLAAHDARRVFARDPAGLAQLDAVSRRMAEHAERRDWSGINQADLAFHRTLILASGNRIVQTLWETLASHLRIIFAWETQGLTDPGAIVEEHAVLRAALAGEGDLDRVIHHHITKDSA